MKYLRVTMPDGSKWDVPANVIANHRALIRERDEQGTYTKELEFAIADDFELEDWAANNMNWRDVQHFAERFEDAPATVDYQEGWTNGEKEVVDV